MDEFFLLRYFLCKLVLFAGVRFYFDWNSPIIEPNAFLGVLWILNFAIDTFWTLNLTFVRSFGWYKLLGTYLAS